jgi:D-beta-D-heptose 7-phosphate kinase/D-beta-D-heptose 1-phosphate adenosyltransferase
MNDLAHTQQQTQFKILLIGDDCLDVYQFGTVDRISPEAPVPIFKYSYTEERPGMARNVKANLEELGCKVTYLSNSTSVKTRLIDIRSKQQIVRIDNDNRSQPITFETDIPNVYDAVVISDYEKGSVSYEVVEEIIQQSNHGIKFPVFIDTKKHDLGRFQGAWVKINEHEYSQIKSDCSGLIVTKGSKGASVVHHNISFPAIPVEVADVCGAGDTFLSALCYQYLNTNDIATAIQFAIKASAVTVQHLGCYAPTLEEINE